MQDFDGKVAVITGGASGVGRSLAFALGTRGARIVVGDVDAAAMETVTGELAKAGIEALVQHCDVTDLESLSALANAADDKMGGMDLVFANAGIGAGETGAMWDYSEKDWQWCLNVNVWGVINSIRAFMP
ncbi:MAG: SDR family NAD(P)-dependent oxidoreductase, partial [Pseudomonadota bacterium]